MPATSSTSRWVRHAHRGQAPPEQQIDAAGLSPDVDLALATLGWGWHLEAGLAALRLILSGALDRHPGSAPACWPTLSTL